MNKDLKNIVENLSRTPSDINEHLITLQNYSSMCSHITEMGVRWIVSTWALLSGNPKKMISYDIENPSIWGADINYVYEVARQNNIDYTFIKADTTKVEIEETDLLFIDTLHIYAQLKTELQIHSPKVKKYIILHDTVSCKDELIPAIDEFLSANNNWKIDKVFINNNGLTILKNENIL